MTRFPLKINQIFSDFAVPASSQSAIARHTIFNASFKTDFEPGCHR